ncbi:AER227Wp [Eremothecium gossypii ATCC 10895]|uniref:AER227Wp n=1 Tax=Eremothecium gossypii (strain ATCC 10895 / CBS 109.51 / FGSC 9923 / NRRL Y-1056) TaxID=284811 RepID=Q756M7_EREGS|nr:AER227Wp [Eremothecium gossypii ATCC 10895]AAS52908.1 AER227Wp [Eremothecium gossypii ATCC 10895]
MSTAELELRRTLADVLDDELRMPDHWNASSHANKSFEDLLILPQEHQEYPLSSPMFKHYAGTYPLGAGTVATGSLNSAMPSHLLASHAPMIDDTHAGYVVADGAAAATANIFNKYADPTLTTTHANGESAASLQQPQGSANAPPLQQNVHSVSGQQQTVPHAGVAKTLGSGCMLTPIQPTISLHSVMDAGSSYMPRLSSACTPVLPNLPSSATATANSAQSAATATSYNQISPSKYNLIDDHQTRIAEQRELELLDDEDYIRDYYMEENGHKMNYFWPLQDNISNSQVHMHDPMQQLFDQDFDDDLSDDDDDDSNSLELLGEDYDDEDRDNDDSQIFDRTRKLNFNPSVSSYLRPLLNSESFVDTEIVADETNGDEFNYCGDDDDNESSVFDDDTLFEGKGARKPSVVCAEKLSREQTAFDAKFLTPSPGADFAGKSQSPVVVSVPIPVKKSSKGPNTAKAEQAGLISPVHNSSTKLIKRLAANRRKSAAAGAAPHVSKKASTPSGGTSSTSNGSSNTSMTASASPMVHHSHSGYHESNCHSSSSNDINEEHTCQLINSITKQPCLKKFSRPYDLIRHQKTIHATKKKIFRCLICIQEHGTEGYQRTFSRGDALSRHVKVKHELVGEEAQKVIQFAKENVEYVEA